MTDERPLGELLGDAADAVRRIIGAEKDLLRAELRPTFRNAGFGGVLLVAALLLAGPAFLLLVIGGCLAVAEGGGTPYDVGFVLVGLLVAAIAGGAATLGLAAAAGLRGPKRTVRTMKDSLRWLRHPTVAPDPMLEDLRASHRTDITGPRPGGHG